MAILLYKLAHIKNQFFESPAKLNVLIQIETYKLFPAVLWVF